MRSKDIALDLVHDQGMEPKGFSPNTTTTPQFNGDLTKSADLTKKWIYDPYLRVLHWAMALMVIVLSVTPKIAAIYFEDGQLRALVWTFHIYAGYGLILVLLARVLWAFAGPKWAGWREFFPIKRWIQIWHFLRKYRGLPRNLEWGHDPLAALVYLAIYSVLIMMSVSGLCLAAIEHFLGPWAGTLYDNLEFEIFIQEFHEIGAWLILILALVHLFGMAWHEKSEGIPITQSMFNGYQYRNLEVTKNEAKEDKK